MEHSDGSGSGTVADLRVDGMTSNQAVQSGVAITDYTLVTVMAPSNQGKALGRPVDTRQGEIPPGNHPMHRPATWNGEPRTKGSRTTSDTSTLSPMLHQRHLHRQGHGRVRAAVQAARSIWPRSR